MLFGRRNAVWVEKSCSGLKKMFGFKNCIWVEMCCDWVEKVLFASFLDRKMFFLSKIAFSVEQCCLGWKNVVWVKK